MYDAQGRELPFGDEQKPRVMCSIVPTIFNTQPKRPVRCNGSANGNGRTGGTVITRSMAGNHRRNQQKSDGIQLSKLQ
jgi:hypothetical protein